MNPEQMIKHEIILDAFRNGDIDIDYELTSDNIDDFYDIHLVDNDLHWDYESEFRSSGEETNIPAEYSRHYESKSVAKRLTNGQWVGWTYWYGGGKHSNPEAVEWMEYSYMLDVTEREEKVIIKDFKKVESNN